MKNRFHNSIIRIDSYKSLSTHHLQPNEILISNFDTAKTALKYYGDSIEKLTFNGEFFTADEVIELSHQIAQYTSPTLKEITLINVDDYLLSKSNYTFSNVISCTIQRDRYSDNLKLFQIYPRMQNFRFISKFLRFRLTSLVRYYNRLEHLELLDSGGLVGENINYFAIIEQNPHIQSLVLNQFPRRLFLEAVSEYLPRLKRLSLAWGYLDSYENERNVHFSGVKSFTIDCIRDGLDLDDEILDRFPITFEQLNTLEVKSLGFNDVPMRLIEQNKRLKVLSLPETDTTDIFPRVLSAIQRLRELEAITLQWSDGVGEGATLRLMNHFGGLKRITFILNKRSGLNVLKAIVPDEWRQLDSEEVVDKRCFVTFVRG